MADIGKKLQEARERLNYDYDYIHQKTKIHPKILRALEEEDFQKFGSLLYLKSFLKKYAQFLGMDVEPLLEQLESILVQERQKETRAVISPFTFTPWQKILFGMRVSISLLLVVVSIYAVFFGIGKIISFIFQKKILQTEVVKLPKEEKVSLPDIIIKESEKKVTTGLKVPLELTILAEEDCWLQLHSDNEKIFEGILRKGQKETWRAQKEFELWVGEASRLKLTLNGTALGPLGRGVIKGIKITPSGLKLP